MSSSGGSFPSFLPAVVVIPSRSGDAVLGRGRLLLLLLPLLSVLPLLLLLSAGFRSSCATTISPCQVHVCKCCVAQLRRRSERDKVNQGKKEIVSKACPELLLMAAVVVGGCGCLHSAPVCTWTPL
jgi:hypothetical protein